MGDIIDFSSRRAAKDRPSNKDLISSGQSKVSDRSNQFHLVEVDVLVMKEPFDEDPSVTVDIHYVEGLRVIDRTDGSILYGVTGITDYLMDGIEWLDVEQFLYIVQNFLIADCGNPLMDTDLVPPPRTYLVNQIHYRTADIERFEMDPVKVWNDAPYHDIAKWFYLRNVSDFFSDRVPDLQLDK